MVVGGAVSLIRGVLGLAGSLATGFNMGITLTVLGGIFFLSGISLLKYRKDTDQISSENSN
jgi:hypothetical protein